MREEAVRTGLDEWLAGLFDPDHVDAILVALTRSQVASLAEQARAEWAWRRLADGPAAGRLLDALEEGFPRDTLREWVTAAAEAEIEAARADLEVVAERDRADEADLRELLRGSSDVAAEMFTDAEPGDLAAFYQAVAWRWSTSRSLGG